MGSNSMAIRQHTPAEISEIVGSGRAREFFKIHDVIEVSGHQLEVIGFDHDEDVNNPDAHTMTVMGKTLLGDHRMNDGECPNGWIESELRGWLASEVFQSLPEDLRNMIRCVQKLTHNGKGEAFYTEDMLFIPSESELFGSAIWSDYEDEKRYEAFACCKDRLRIDADGDYYPYWTRSSYGGSSTNFAYVTNDGTPYYLSASNTCPSAPLCFNF